MECVYIMMDISILSMNTMIINVIVVVIVVTETIHATVAAIAATVMAPLQGIAATKL